MKQVKGSHLAFIALACAMLGGIAAGLWMKQRQGGDAKVLASVARVERVDGQVGVGRNIGEGADPERWVEAAMNTPLSAGDRIYARDNSRASVAFTGRNFARLDPRTSLDVMYLAPDRTQLALRDGSALFDLGELESGQLFEVATPFGAVDFDQPGLYQVGYNDDGNPYVSVLSGLARVVGLAGSGQVSKGEMLTLLGQTAADLVLSKLDPSYAGGLVNDYYGYRYPDIYDGRYSSYDAYLNDPYYYDPYNRYASYRHVSDYIPGVRDLDAYGDWQDVSGYGYLWRPRVAPGWTPYQQGYWDVDDPYGLTWVSSEPWGYAPYHYGRWAFVNNQWYWVPEAVNTQPAYAPALVAFLPMTQANEVGWVPLGPGDPYVQTYYDQNWQPHYVGTAPTVQQVVNLNVPGAVTAVPVQYLSGIIDERVVRRVDPQAFAQVRPVLDPFTVNYLRQAALQPPRGRRPFDVPPGIARKLEETRVIASTAPAALPFMPNRTQAMRVEVVPDDKRRQKLQFRNERQAATAQGPDGEGRPTPGRGRATVRDEQHSQQAAALAAEAARGNRGARRQLQQLQRQEREQQRAAAQQQRQAPPQAANERVEPQRARGERVGMRPQPQPRREQQMRARPPQPQARPQAPPPQARPERPQPQPQAQRPQPQMRQQGPPQRQNVQRSQEPPPQAARPQAAKSQPPQAQGHGGKGKGRP
jgi:hypothetical protein